MSSAVATLVEPSTEHTSVSCAQTAPWHVVWTHSNCEDLVSGQLAAAGFHPFVPKIEQWARRNGTRRAVNVPLFAGYLFLNDALDKTRHVAVRKARGVVAILGEGWDRPALIPAAEIEAIRKVVETRVRAFAHPYLKEGRRVRIEAGPLAGVEGILVRVRPDKGLLVLSVDLLQRSVAVEVDWTQVAPA
ncbi:MAG: NusG-like protein [Acidobacteria bacterium]|nr:MAG: NusG-like protein [Acidobacteriota bacterium]